MTAPADGFSPHTSVFAHVHASAAGEFGHIYIHFNNLLPDVRLHHGASLRVTSQSSTKNYGDDSERGKGHIYGLRFGLVAEDACLADVQDALKVMTRIERRLKKLAEKHGSVRWDSDFVTFALRHIMASGVEWVVFNDQLDPVQTWVDTAQLPRTRATLTHEVGASLQRIADRMVARFTQVAA